MSKYQATITFDLPGRGEDGIDALTAAALISERMFSEAPEFVVDAITVERVDA